MDDGTVKAARGGLALAACLVAGLAGLALLTQTVENSDVFGRWHDTILIANVLGALALLGVLAVNLVQPAPRPAADRCRARAEAAHARRLRRHRRRPGAGRVPGVRCSFSTAASRPGRTAASRTGLEHSLQLSRAALDAELRTDLDKTRDAAARLSGLRAGADDRGAAGDSARGGRPGDDRLRPQLPHRRHQQRGRRRAAFRSCPARTCCCSCHATAATWPWSPRARTSCGCARP